MFFEVSRIIYHHFLAAARDFHVDAFAVKDIRKATGLTQDTFAQHIGIEVLHCVTGNKGDVSKRGLLRHC